MVLSPTAIALANKPPAGAQIKYGHALARNLIYAIPFNESAGSYIHETLSGSRIQFNNTTPTWQGGGVYFDGTSGSFARTTAGPVLKNVPFTCSVIVSRITTNSNGVFGIGSVGGTRQQIHLRFSNSTTMVFGLFSDDLTVTVPTYGVSNFFHAVIRLDDKFNQVLFIDGKQVGQRTAGGLFTGTTTLNLANFQAGPGVTACRLHQVLVWNRALGNDDIKQLYYNPWIVYRLVKKNYFPAATTFPQTLTLATSPSVSFSETLTFPESLTLPVTPSVAFTENLQAAETLTLPVTPSVSFAVNGTFPQAVTFAVTPSVSFSTGATFDEALMLAIAPSVAFDFALVPPVNLPLTLPITPSVAFVQNLLANEPVTFPITPLVSFTSTRRFPESLVLAVSPSVAFVIDGGAPAPPDPPPPPISCEAPPGPGYSAIATIYDEPSERIGS